MLVWHGIPELPAPLDARAVGEHRVRIAFPGVGEAEFDVLAVGTLTARLADDLIRTSDRTRPVLIAYRRSSREARTKLREAAMSYAGSDRRLYLRAPGIYVEREDLAVGEHHAARDLENEASGGRNPFATRGSRVPRWLLLHHRERFSVSQIARAVDMSAPAVSRLVRALEDRAVIGEEESDDARRRRIMLTRPRALLDEWVQWWQRRRIRQRWWDIGARDADEALAAIADATAGEQRPGWAIGGLAGATHWQRAVEPADVLLWIDKTRLTTLTERLEPAPGRVRGGRGSLRVAVAPDAWVLSLAEEGELPIADPVQVWLDCATEGERALEAADGVAEAVGW
jgi:AraC-like DNA-binding protein